MCANLSFRSLFSHCSSSKYGFSINILTVRLGLQLGFRPYFMIHVHIVLGTHTLYAHPIPKQHVNTRTRRGPVTPSDVDPSTRPLNLIDAQHGVNGAARSVFSEPQMTSGAAASEDGRRPRRKSISIWSRGTPRVSGSIEKTANVARGMFARWSGVRTQRRRKGYQGVWMAY